MKNILVPTDFSKTADNALNVAADLARKHGADIYLLHLLDLPFDEIDAMGGHSALPESMFFMKLAHKRFEEVMSREELKDITIHEVVEFNKPFSGVMDACKKYDTDLIVMGSHGTSGLKEIFIGSNTEKVVRSSQIPVLVIKKEHDSFEINNIVFASDFNKDNKETYRQASALAEQLDAKIDLLMINTPNNFITTKEAKARIHNFIGDVNYANYDIHIYNDESVEKGILNFADGVDADLIGISTHGRQGIAHIFNGSISEDLVNHADRPVITFKINQ